MHSKIGLVLSGGGARGAYQAGVLKAMSEVLPQQGTRNPFPIITGISAGALNAGYLAANAEDFAAAATKLCRLWTELKTDYVFRSDIWSLGSIAMRLLTPLFTGGLYRSSIPPALLDTSPLKEFLGRVVPFSKIKTNLHSGCIDAVSITANDYASGGTVSFVQTKNEVPLWNRTKRIAVQEEIGLEHLLASSALPVIFPPVKIGERFYGDGSLRNNAPLSPALHLGAEKLMIISVRKEPAKNMMETNLKNPSLGRVFSVVLNSILMDSTTSDLERLERINRTVSLIPHSATSKTGLRGVEYITISPSEDIGQIAKQEAKELPRTIRYLIRGLGSKSESSDLISYLLFEKSFTSRLLELGYNDALRQKDKLAEFAGI